MVTLSWSWYSRKFSVRECKGVDVGDGEVIAIEDGGDTVDAGGTVDVGEGEVIVIEDGRDTVDAESMLT